jgi:hypothetical protein
MIWLILLLSFNVYALEVIKPKFNEKMELKIVRVETDSFSTYLLITKSLTELTLVCANNTAYDHNSRAFIEFRNYYREVAGNFIIESNDVCLELGRFIESTQSGVTAENPFIITLDRKKMKVKKIVYPNLDPFALDSEVESEVKEFQRPTLQ